ncbi:MULTISPECIES: site-specific DNA-methyltransferase [unclassified Streptomyces]|uniref:site-specific DNA-methyltransferase n=1 Tax=unclassified Streptomyces TaxID=2593676 RepID=UPI00136EAB60|nr:MULTISPECIES: site-specific DNA-methyltransferase [unclassified Streptomyces]MYZ40058.1 hypothetical protein [Streptomyces sp. SID4917]
MELSTGDLVVDPFTGSGVTGTSCRGADVLFYGIEAHPLIAELADLKLRKPPADLGDLEKRASSFEYLADRSRQALGKRAMKIIERETELVQRSFDTRVLLALILLREMIKNDADE